MSITLVTGGTHGLGVPTVELLRAAGHDVRVLSRSAGAGRYQGDLATGAGLDAALGGVDTVVHLATSRRRDIGHTRHVLDAAKRAGIAHLVFISIVGVDRIPYGYYRDKVASEQAIAGAGIPFTILRATSARPSSIPSSRRCSSSACRCCWHPRCPCNPLPPRRLLDGWWS